jgi:large-conductance mechanosensitive channel
MNSFFEVQQEEPEVRSSKKKIGVLDEIKKLLTTNATTIITVSISIAIGTAFNTLITSFISDVIRPLCIKLLLLSHLHHVLYNIDQIVYLQNPKIA